METVKCRKFNPVVMAVLVVLASVFFFICYGLFVSEAADPTEITAGQIVYNLYAYGGFVVICLVCMAVTSLVRRKYKDVVIRVFMWCCLLLAYHFASTFFANAFNLSLLNFQQDLIYAAEYLPALFLSVSVISLICQWNRENRRFTYMLTWVLLLVSVFLSAWFIYYKVSSMVSYDAVIIYDMLFSVAHAIVMPMAIAFIWNCARTNGNFCQSMLSCCECEKCSEADCPEETAGENENITEETAETADDEK